MMRRLGPSAVPAWTTGDLAADDGAADGQPSRNDKSYDQPVSELFHPAPTNCRVVRQSDGGRGEFAGRLQGTPAEPPKHRSDTSTMDGVGSQEHYRLVLLVAGNSGRSRQAAANLRLVCNEHLAGRFDLQIIDIREQPQLARTYQVVAVPTLLKLYPEPKRIIGDLSNRQRVLDGLELSGR